jgi:UDP-glucuronate 4-epimerase
MKHALVTGGAGFIGSHLVDRLLAEGWSVTCVDNFEPFYDPEIKARNAREHATNDRFRLVTADVRDFPGLRKQLSGRYDVVVHLAAKAGIQPSVLDPFTYQQVNVAGTLNMLELAREWGVAQFVFASSSSVYGISPAVPWREDDHALLPISPYASSKISAELLGHVYSHLYGIRFIALRFFTVYGPRQRPDLAIHKFARLMVENRPVPVYGDGSTRRDYTYIGDIVDGVRAAMNYTASRHEVINLGNGRAVSLLETIQMLEAVLGVKAHLEWHPAQLGDVPQTYADIHKARELLGYEPRTELMAGLRKFVEWMTTKS